MFQKWIIPDENHNQLHHMFMLQVLSLLPNPSCVIILHTLHYKSLVWQVLFFSNYLLFLSESEEKRTCICEVEFLTYFLQMLYIVILQIMNKLCVVCIYIYTL